MKLKLVLMIIAGVIAGCSTEETAEETDVRGSDEMAEDVSVEDDGEDAAEGGTEADPAAASTEDENPTGDAEEEEADLEEHEAVSEEEDEEDEVQEDPASAAGTGDSKYIDVLSDAFINEFFSGPAAYIPHEINIGMSQSEIEEIYGVHDTYYQMEGANLAIYGNVGLFYSEGFPAGEGGFDDIDPDDNFVTDTAIYMNIPHDTIVSAYGQPTLDYDEYVLQGPGAQSMIYDGTRGNGYAVFIEMSEDTAMLMRKGEEWDLESLSNTDPDMEGDASI